MRKEDIEKVALDSYKTYFHDQEAKSQHGDIDHDIVLNKEQLTENVNLKKVDKEKKHKSLEVLREKLVQEAEESYENVFSEEKLVNLVHKKTTTEMYDELINEKNHLSEMTQDLKEKQMKKMHQ